MDGGWIHALADTEAGAKPPFEVCDCVNCNEPINSARRYVCVRVCLPKSRTSQMIMGQILICRDPPIPEQQHAERTRSLINFG